MGSDRRLPPPTTILPGMLAALVLVLGACTADSGAASVEASAGESMAASMDHSMAASAEESAAGSESAEGETVTIVNFAYDPAELTVAAGTTVTFVNEDTAPHTVTEGEDGQEAEDARVDEEVAAGESVEVTFEEAGDYSITCLFHPEMNMVVHVE